MAKTIIPGTNGKKILKHLKDKKVENQQKVDRIVIKPGSKGEKLLQEMDNRKQQIKTKLEKKFKEKQEADRIYGWKPSKSIEAMMREKSQKGTSKLIGEYMQQWGYVEKTQVQQEVVKVLNQLKAQMDKLKKQFEKDELPIAGINRCITIVDNKIKSIK